LIGWLVEQGDGSRDAIKEQAEFARVAVFSQPVKSALSSRFTSSGSSVQKPSYAAPAPAPEVSIQKQKNKTKQKASKQTNKHTNNFSFLTNQNMYVSQAPIPTLATFKVARTDEEWRPHRLLCKRMNVPDPFVNKVKQHSLLIFLHFIVFILFSLFCCFFLFVVFCLRNSYSHPT
jgi:hypothetical protein